MANRSPLYINPNFSPHNKPRNYRQQHYDGADEYANVSPTARVHDSSFQRQQQAPTESSSNLTTTTTRYTATVHRQFDNIQKTATSQKLEQFNRPVYSPNSSAQPVMDNDRETEQYANLPTVRRATYTRTSQPPLPARPAPTESSPPYLKTPPPQQQQTYDQKQDQYNKRARQFSPQPTASTTAIRYPPTDNYFPKNFEELRGERVETVFRKRDTGLGITIVGGENNDPLQVKSIVRGGAAEIDGVLQPGDVLVNVNGMNVLNFTHDMIISVFKALDVGQDVRIVACRGYPLFTTDEDDVETAANASSITENVREYAVDTNVVAAARKKDQRAFEQKQREQFIDHTDDLLLAESSPAATAPPYFMEQSAVDLSKSMPNLFENNVEELVIPIRKGSYGFGFTIEQSRSSGYQKIKKITDPARCRDLMKGDLLIQIDDQPLSSLGHDDIATILKRYPPHEEAVFYVLRPHSLRNAAKDEPPRQSRQSGGFLSSTLPRARSRSISSAPPEKQPSIRRRSQSRTKHASTVAVTPVEDDEEEHGFRKQKQQGPKADDGEKRTFFTNLFGSGGRKSRKQSKASRQKSYSTSESESESQGEATFESPPDSPPQIEVQKFEQEKIAVEKHTVNDDEIKKDFQRKSLSDRFRIRSGMKKLPSPPPVTVEPKQKDNKREKWVESATFASTPQLNNRAEEVDEATVGRPRSRTPMSSQIARLVTPIFVTASRYTTPAKNKQQTTPREEVVVPRESVVEEQTRSAQQLAHPDVNARRQTTGTNYAEQARRPSSAAAAKPPKPVSSTIVPNQPQQPRYGIEKTNINNVKSFDVSKTLESVRNTAPLVNNNTNGQKLITSTTTKVVNVTTVLNDNNRDDDDDGILSPSDIRNEARVAARRANAQHNERSPRFEATDNQYANVQNKREVREPPSNMRPWTPLDRQQQLSPQRIGDVRSSITGPSPPREIGSITTMKRFRNYGQEAVQPTETIAARQTSQQKFVGFEKSILLKSDENGFGFRVIGGSEDNTQVAVGYITPGGAADRDRRLRVGDEIISVDNKSTVGAAHEETVEKIRRASEVGMILLVVLRRYEDKAEDEPLVSRAVIKAQQTAKSEQASLVPVRIEHAPLVAPLHQATTKTTRTTSELTSAAILTSQQPVEIVKVTLRRRSDEGFGFVLVSTAPLHVDGQQQNKAEPLNSLDAYPMIGKILPHTPAGRCQAVKVGDRLLRVNNVDVHNYEHRRVVELIKNAGLVIVLTLATSPMPENLFSNENNASSHRASATRPSSGSAVDETRNGSSGTSTSQQQSDRRPSTNSQHTANPIHIEQTQQTINHEYYNVPTRYTASSTRNDSVSHQAPVFATTTAAAARMKNNSSSAHTTQQSADQVPSSTSASDVMYESVELPRGPHGFGFSIRGGKDFHGTPLHVLKIADDGPAAAAAANGSLCSGDEVVEINGRNARNMTHAEAIGLIRDGSKDTVKLLLKRPRYVDDDAYTDEV